MAAAMNALSTGKIVFYRSLQMAMGAGLTGLPGLLQDRLAVLSQENRCFFGFTAEAGIV